MTYRTYMTHFYSSLRANQASPFSGHHFFAVLISADPLCHHARKLFGGFQLNQLHFTINCVAGKNGTVKLEGQLACNEIQIPANLGRQGRRE